MTLLNLYRVFMLALASTDQVAAQLHLQPSCRAGSTSGVEVSEPSGSEVTPSLDRFSSSFLQLSKRQTKQSQLLEGSQLSKKKVELTDVTIITGTGRSGTTFLMALLSDLGLPTGYTAKNATDAEKLPAHAGLEILACACLFPAWCPNATCMENVEIFKSPMLAQEREWMNDTLVGHVIVPVRDMAEVAESRASAGNYWLNASSAMEMEEANEKLISGLLVDLVLHDQSVTFLASPRFMEDPLYTYTKLQWLFDRYGVTYDIYEKAHQERYRPELLHTDSLSSSGHAVMQPKAVQ